MPEQDFISLSLQLLLDLLDDCGSSGVLRELARLTCYQDARESRFRLVDHEETNIGLCVANYE